MLTRILTGLVAVCILVPILFLSDTWFFCFMVGIVTVIQLFEILRCMGLEKSHGLTLPLYAAGMVFPFLTRYLPTMWQVGSVALLCAIAYLMILFAVVVWSHGRVNFSVAMTAYAFCLYILFAMSAIIYIRDFSDYGRYFYLLIFIGAWITDTFAYFTGMLFGKHKLIPDVSPKKTVEGSIGGTLFCVGCYILFGILMNRLFDADANLIFLAVSGFLIALVSQIGDLIMSVIKRHYGIKDYGKIFPGHGGMLDRFDSLLAVSVCLAAVCVFSVLTGIRIF